MDQSVIVKTFALLEALADGGGWMGLGELAQAVGLAKPTAHRTLKQLVALGYAQRADTGRYRLGPRVRELAQPGRQAALVERAEPVLRRLRDLTGETVNLAVLRQDGVVYLRMIESSHALRWVGEPSRADPFHSTALGRAIVAHLDAARRTLLLRGRLEKTTPQTVTDPKAIAAILTETRRRGWAHERDQSVLGGECFAVPLFENGHPTAGVSVSAPSARIDEKTRKRIVAALLKAGRELSTTDPTYEESKSA